MPNTLRSRHFPNASDLQTRDEVLAQKNASARAVPVGYRFDELQCLERWERPILVDKARRYAVRQPKVLALGALLGVVAIYFACICLRDRILIPVVAAWVGSVVLMLPAYFYRRIVMRDYIRRKVFSMRRSSDIGVPL